MAKRIMAAKAAAHRKQSGEKRVATMWQHMASA